ncbi:MAG: tetratricopeptide repeat protein [bacterium]
MYFEAFSSLPVTRCCDLGQKAIRHNCQELLCYGPNLRDLFQAAEAAPDCALLNAYAACLHLAFEGAEGWSMAHPYLTKMRKAAAYDLQPREQLYCAATEAWADRHYKKALQLFEQIALAYPADLIALKWGQYHAFNLGDQHALMRFGTIAASTFPDAPYVHGMLAFALEQNHQIKEAETAARRATEIAIDDAWAHHAIAHVMETEGRPQDGIDWLSKCSHIWDSKGIFIREHNWWHMALFHLSLGDHQGALEIFDTQLWGAWPEFPQEQIGASSMLWRMELAGMTVGQRWQPVLEKVREHAGEMVLPFHELHYLFALTHAENPDEASHHYNIMVQASEHKSGDDKISWEKAALPTAKAIIAFANKDYETTYSTLMQAAPFLPLIGGSHAQRAIFSKTMETAQNRAGQPTITTRLN